MNMISG